MCAINIRFFLPQPSGLKDVEKLPDNTGMGAISEELSKDTKSRRNWDRTPRVFSILVSVLQRGANNESMLPNPKTLKLVRVNEGSIPSIRFLLSPRTTSISISFDMPGFPKAMVASMIASFPELSP